MFKIKSPSYKNRQETGYLIWYFLSTKLNSKIRFYNCHRSSYKEGFAILSIFNSMENYNPLFDLERNTIFKLILTLLHRESQKLWSGHLLHLFFPNIWQGRNRLWQNKSHDGDFQRPGPSLSTNGIDIITKFLFDNTSFNCISLFFVSSKWGNLYFKVGQEIKMQG